MARVTFLWHLHQPLYRTADGRVHAPWTLLHAAGEYLTLAHALEHSEWKGHVLNVTPVFLDQLAAYRDGTARDPLLEALRTPARDLDEAAQRELLRWVFLLHPRRFQRWPRLAELAARTTGASLDELPRRFTVQDLTDLQVLLVLAYGEPNMQWEPGIRDLTPRARGFSDKARAQAVTWLAACPGRLIEAYKRLAASGIEIATSPWAHPIMPLLLGTEIVRESWAPHPAPPVPRFSAPEDAAQQLRAGLATAREFGFSPVGCWPPEGSVSEAAAAVYQAQGIKWLTTDEGILAASLGHTLSNERGVGGELFAPWQLASGGPYLFFRHRELSDFIGFQGKNYPDESRATLDFADQLRRLAHRAGPDGGIVVALDGENPWTSYPEGGARFLSTLDAELRHSGELKAATLTERVETEIPRTLSTLHPGSWIGGTFATWIGHPEKNRGWELLGEARARGAWRGGKSWLAAEGSDWWWWFGDDNPTFLAPLYDDLFRAHVRDACEAAGVAPPPGVSAPVRSAAVRVRVPLSREWPQPVLDGRTTTYFEWAIAAWFEAPASHRYIARVALRGDGTHLWLRVDPKPGTGAPVPVAVTVVAGTHRNTWVLPTDLPQDCAIGSCLEASLPIPPRSVLFALEQRGERIPPEGFWQIEFQEVDEP